MEDLNLKELRTWRKRFGLTLKKLAELAKISPVTLRHLEIGKHKPQKRTIINLLSALRVFETSLKRESRNTSEAGAIDSSTSGNDLASALLAEAVNPGSGAGDLKSHSVAPSQRNSGDGNTGSISLSNIDLELINRILNMTNQEKLNLLQQLI